RSARRSAGGAEREPPRRCAQRSRLLPWITGPVGCYGPKTMPRVRRLRREAPTLELLSATLPELRLGLSDSAARTLAYEVFAKLGFGAVAVTDGNRVLAFVGAGADHHQPGDEPIRPVFEALAADETRVAPLALRTSCGHPACPLGAAAIVPLRVSDGPIGSLVVFAT